MSRVRTIRRLQALAVSGAMVLGIAACGGNDSGGEGGGDSDEPIRIGASLPLTG